MGEVTNTVVSDWSLIDEDRTRAYAELTDDYNPIHLDPKFAAATPLGVPIAYGTVSLALLVSNLRDLVGADALAAGRVAVRFKAPVPVGSRVRARIEQAPDGSLALSVERDDGKIVISGQFVKGSV